MSTAWSAVSLKWLLAALLGVFFSLVTFDLVQYTGRGAAESGGTSLAPDATPGFSVSVAPAGAGAYRGWATTWQVTVTPTGGFTGPVDLAAAGLPAGATAVFSNDVTITADHPVTSTLIVDTRAAAEAGSTSVTVTGTAGAIAGSAHAELQIEELPDVNFTLTLTPRGGGSTVPPHGLLRYDVGVDRAGNRQDLVLDVPTNLPPGITASFDPARTTGDAAVLELRNATGAPVALWPFVVSAAADGFQISVYRQSPRVAARLALAEQPAEGAQIRATGTGSFPVAVRVEDARGGLMASDDTTDVTLALGDNPADGVLSCDGGLTATAAEGIATFTGCAVTKAGEGYALTATSGALEAPANANAFDVVAGDASRLALVGDASSLASGTSRSYTATIEDVSGNVVSETATVAFAADGTGSLDGLGDVEAVDGVATTSVTGVRAGQVTLRAVTGSALSASAEVEVVAGEASRLELTGATSDLASGSDRQLTATIEDAAGNAVPTDATVSFAQVDGTGDVTGLGDAAAAGGAATRAVIGRAAGTVTLRATASSLESNELTLRVVAGDTTRLVITTPSRTTQAGFDSLPITVQRLDAAGNPVTSGSTALGLSSTSATGVFVDGIAVSGVTIPAASSTTSFAYRDTTVGTPTLAVSASGVASATQKATITPGTGALMTIEAGDGQSATVGTPFGTRQAVKVTDASLNPVAGVLVTFTAPGAGASGSFADGGTATTNASGVATAPLLTAGTVAGSYAIAAASGGLGVSFSATNTPGAAHHLAWAVQPGGVLAGQPVAPAPAVRVEDAFGNALTGDAGRAVTMTVASGPGTFAAGSTTTVATSGGTATFASLLLGIAGSYIIEAQAASLASSGASAAFTIGSASGLPYTITATVPQQLYPGAAASVLPIAFDSPNVGDGGTRVSSLTISIGTVTSGAPGPNPCTAADFELTQIAAGAYPFFVPGGVSALSSLIAPGDMPTIRMVESGDNQDACKGATVQLTFVGAP